MAAGGWKGCAVRRAARTTHAAHAMVVAGVVGHGGAQWHHALCPGCPATDPPSSRRRRETAATRPAAAAAAHRRRTRGGGTTTARGRTRERRSSRVVACGTRREREGRDANLVWERDSARDARDEGENTAEHRSRARSLCRRGVAGKRPRSDRCDPCHRAPPPHHTPLRTLKPFGFAPSVSSRATAVQSPSPQSAFFAALKSSRAFAGSA